MLIQIFFLLYAYLVMHNLCTIISEDEKKSPVKKKKVIICNLSIFYVCPIFYIIYAFLFRTGMATTSRIGLDDSGKKKRCINYIKMMYKLYQNWTYIKNA